MNIATASSILLPGCQLISRDGGGADAPSRRNDVLHPRRIPKRTNRDAGQLPALGLPDRRIRISKVIFLSTMASA
jgi:hypothetical protein